jgi:ABC-type transport system involved in cytochrome c biogenesis permease subunit
VANRASKSTMLTGVVALAVGIAGTVAASATATPDWWPAGISKAVVPELVAILGVLMMILAQFGRQSRAPLTNSVVASSSVSSVSPELAFAETEVEPALATVGAGSMGGSGAVSTIARPSIADRIRAKARDAGSDGGDPRLEAMQATAAKIKPLSNFVYRAMQVGVLLVAAGTILGGVWADVSWGRFWGWDPKEVWALITLLVYLIPLHGRFAGWVSTFGLIVASVVCYMSVLMAWYGVNFVLGVGLHSYGFVEGGGQGVVWTVAAAVIAVAAAAGLRRHLAQQSPVSALQTS